MGTCGSKKKKGRLSRLRSPLERKLTETCFKLTEWKLRDVPENIAEESVGAQLGAGGVLPSAISKRLKKTDGRREMAIQARAPYVLVDLVSGGDLADKTKTTFTLGGVHKQKEMGQKKVN